MYKQTKFYAIKRPEMRAIQIWIYKDSPSPEGKKSVGESIIFRELTKEDEGMISDPALTLDHTEAQNLIDALWNEGIRPSDVGTAGHLEAVKYHLEDMRRLVFERD